MKVALCQINPTVGALNENTLKICEIIKEYSTQCDLLIFPEMVLTGYPPQDLLLDESFIQKTEEALGGIASYVKDTAVILGSVRRVKDHLYNTAVIFQGGEILGYRYKTHLPTYDVFDE
ncbi:uncharacterized protein METZ01_LOCUS415095, partial [marine metagenome]